jgi:hypothetical protein
MAAINSSTLLAGLALAGTTSKAISGFFGGSALNFFDSLNANEVIDGAGKYQGNYRFPLDLINPDIGRNFYIDIQFQQYQRRSIFEQVFLRASGGIQLPIPASLSDKTSTTWSKESGPTVGAALETALQGRSSSDGFNFNLSGNVLQNAGGGYALDKLKGLSKGASSQVLQSMGLAQNPFMTMLFQSVEFKTHSFSWTFAPRNMQETYMLAEIIQAFKSNMLPSMTAGAGGVLLNYPNMANITLYPNDYFMYKFKPSVVTSLTVDFTPEGPSFFGTTKAPTHVVMTVGLQEIEYWLKEDIDSPGGSNGVGGRGEGAGGFGVFALDKIANFAGDLV